MKTNEKLDKDRFRRDLGKVEEAYLEFIKGILTPKYYDEIGKEIQRAYLESYSDYGQNIFDRYISYADHWIQDQQYKDHDTGQLISKDALEEELEKLEKPAGVTNSVDFRHEVVNFVLRFRAKNKDKNPGWNGYQKMKDVIEKKMFASTEELLPVISFETKKSSKDKKKHEDFVSRMESKGYTRRQIKRVVDFYMRYSKSN